VVTKTTKKKSENLRAKCWLRFMTTQPEYEGKGVKAEVQVFMAKAAAAKAKVS
jgi:hypothetical protein